MLNLYSKLQRIQREKNLKVGGGKSVVHVGYFLVGKNFGFFGLNNNSKYFDVDTVDDQVELIS